MSTRASDYPGGWAGVSTVRAPRQRGKSPVRLGMIVQPLRLTPEQVRDAWRKAELEGR